MPVWVSAYFAGYLAFSGWSYASDIHDRTQHRRLALEFVSDVCLLIAAASYWHPRARELFAGVVLPAFTLGVLGLATVFYLALRTELPDPEMSIREQIAAGSVGVLGGLVLSGPLLWWGVQSAVMTRYAAAP